MNGKLAHTRILKEDFAATGALPSDTEDVMNMTLQIGGGNGRDLGRAGFRPV
ncbi:MAG: hypothetical protein QM775_33305 [Pirellulales bacterium]